MYARTHARTHAQTHRVDFTVCFDAIDQYTILMTLDQPPGLEDVSGPICTERAPRFADEVDDVRREQR